MYYYVIIVVLLFLITTLSVKKRQYAIIVSLVRNPIDFNTWLNHHFKIGIDKFYIRIEETPELRKVIEKHPRKNDIHAEYVDNVDKTNNWHNLQTRQKDFCEKTIKNLQNVNGWIFQNIDDDELLYTPKGNIHKCLKYTSFYKQSIFIPTIEAVYPKVSDKCFSTKKFVKCDSRSLCTSYYGGKSCGRISNTLKPYGPHYFQGLLWKGNKSIFCDNTTDMYILHHESCNFQKWKTKFKALTQGGKKIPHGFSFYNDSIDVIKSGDENRMRAFYKKHKVDPYYSKNTVLIDI